MECTSLQNLFALMRKEDKLVMFIRYHQIKAKQANGTSNQVDLLYCNLYHTKFLDRKMNLMLIHNKSYFINSK